MIKAVNQSVLLIILTFILHFPYSSSSTTTSTSPTAKASTSPYKIVIDGGSTGSRLHIFEFKHDSQLNKTFVQRRGSKRVNIPLSDFVPSKYKSSPTEATQNNNDNLETSAGLHLLPLFKYASEVIPSCYHSTTTISIQATAGMRLVNEEDQHTLYNIIHESLVNHDEFVFGNFQRSDINTLNGVWEGLYGVIAVNYLKGIIDVHLHYEKSNNHDNSNNIDIVLPNNNESEKRLLLLEDGRCHDHDDKVISPLGALDLGGASLQVVYYPRTTVSSSSSPTCPNNNIKKKLPSHEFFSKSYLSYGSDQFRERLWDTLIMDSHKNKEQNDITEQYEQEASTTSLIIYNPCAFKGYQTEWKGFILLGTGDTKQCTTEINRLIPHHVDVYDHDYAYNQDIYMVGGVEHPPINGEFYAMSLFFFVMDCVRFYTNDKHVIQSWPNPSLYELNTAIESFCSKDWLEDLATSHQNNPHQFTRAEILAERCFESVYIITLLRDGFGFDIHSRNITYSFHVEGSEVEWSLGMAIKSFADDNADLVDGRIDSLSSSIDIDINENNRGTVTQESCEENITEYNCNNKIEENDDEDEIINQYFNQESNFSRL